MDLPPRAAWRVTRPARGPGSPRLEGLLEEGADAIPVRVEIVQDGVRTGWDDGALGFEDDAVWFSGRACSFRVAALDVRPGAYLLSRHEAVTDGEALLQGLPLRHPTREVWVRIGVLGTEGKAERERLLIDAVKRLRALDHAGTSGSYPPLAPRPGLLRHSCETWREAVRLAALPSGLVGVLLLLLAATMEREGHVTPVTFVTRIVATGFLFFGIYGSRHDPPPPQSALRRIAAEEEAPP